MRTFSPLYAVHRLKQNGTAKGNQSRRYAAIKRMEFAEEQGRQCGCDVVDCHKVPTRFIGNKKLGWLSFCSKHKEEALAIQRWMAAHFRV